jgi:membrane protease YdiL (CAAX protease family)
LVGEEKLPLPVNLPVSALTAFVPMIAAAILSFKRHGIGGIKELFQIVGDYRTIKSKVWYLPILLLAPLIYLFSFAVMRLMERPLPDPIYIPFLWLPVFFVIYLITGAGEELGWSAYATPPMQHRLGPLRASFLLGVIWATWHSIAFVQTGLAVEWVVWQSVKTVAMRMIIMWIYNKTGMSVFAVNLYHTTDNVSWSLFPNFGTHYDPMVTGLINCLTAVIVAIAGGLNSLSRSHTQE